MIGTKIKHPVWGIGEVVESVEVDGGCLYLVCFEKSDKEHLKRKFFKADKNYWKEIHLHNGVNAVYTPHYICPPGKESNHWFYCAAEIENWKIPTKKKRKK